MAATRRAGARSVDDYLARLPDDKRAALERVRKRVLAAAPHVTETISYQMPAFVHEGRAFLWMGAFRHHCSLFPGAVRFRPDEPLPPALIRKLVKAGIAEVEARAAERAAKRAPKKPLTKRAKPSGGARSKRGSAERTGGAGRRSGPGEKA